VLARERFLEQFEALSAVADHNTPPALEVAPLEFDFDRDPEPPAYVVDRLFERQTVNVVSGDTGAGKSIVLASLIVAVCTDRGEWLGRDVDALRVLCVDEENPSRVVRDRLRALGMRNQHCERLRYFNRQGFNIGTPAWTACLRGEAAEHRAELIVIDTASAATNAEVNDNDTVTRLFTEALRPIATDLDAAVVLLHHERKQQPGQPANPGQAMMGARQWAGQSDTDVALRIVSPLSEETAENGNRLLRSEVVMRTPKVRDGEPDNPRLVVVTSEKEKRKLLWLSVTDGGRFDRAPRKQDTLADRLVALLSDQGEMSRSQIATELDVDEGGSLNRALKGALTASRISRIKKGIYGPTTPQPQF